MQIGLRLKEDVLINIIDHHGEMYTDVSRVYIEGSGDYWLMIKSRGEEAQSIARCRDQFGKGLKPFLKFVVDKMASTKSGTIDLRKHFRERKPTYGYEPTVAMKRKTGVSKSPRKKH